MFTVAEIAAATHGRMLVESSAVVNGISTDSRSAAEGQLFVPLRGERFDGHDYLPQVATAGVRVCLAEERWLKQHDLPEGLAGVAVKDSLRALGDLAAAYRKRFELTMIGVTGSNGKTTTKEMLASILGLTGPGLATEGNLNNLIGLPQMVFRLQPDHCWVVLEMGMSEPGEIDRLAEIAQPKVGIVLNAFPAHLQSMGSVEAVAKAKGELLHRISDNGLAVVNGDDPRIASLPQNASAKRISFGISRGEVRAENIRSHGADGQSFTLVTPLGDVDVRLAACGSHNIYNALAAAAALLEKVPLEIIAAGLANFTPYKGRFRIEQVGPLTLIDDSYNANPASTAAALATLAEIKGSAKAFVALGDMLELGGDGAELHRLAGVQAAQVADRLYLVGDLTSHTAEGARSAGLSAEQIKNAMNHEDVAADIMERAQPGDFVLVKGSRGMRMEKIAELIRQRHA
ncbi:MAG: UDP-N-acetylmuramoyl-tripeptide--D-alanyl-D-alanine ligase [Trichlorobacter sp.]